MVDAAATLGVSSRQVERLAQAGDIVVTRRVGRSLLLDSLSVHRCAQMGRHRGRPWSEQAAWGALALLSSLSVDWLPAAHRTRLRDRLRRSTADEVAYLARRRQARIMRMHGWGLEMTGPGSVVIAGGASALDTNPQMAEKFELTTRYHEGADGYVQDAHVEAVADAFGLVPDLEGDVTLRSSPTRSRSSPTVRYRWRWSPSTSWSRCTLASVAPAPVSCRSCSTTSVDGTSLALSLVNLALVLIPYRRTAAQKAS